MRFLIVLLGMLLLLPLVSLAEPFYRDGMKCEIFQSDMAEKPASARILRSVGRAVAFRVETAPQRAGSCVTSC
jgi:hypothetical protein